MFSTNRVATRFHVGEHKRGRGVVFTTPSGHPHPQSSLFHAHATAAAPPSSAWGGTMIVPPPPGERTHQSTQTPQANTGSSANTQPQPPASKHAHSKPQQVRPQANTRNVPTPTRVGTPSVSAGTRVLAEATGTNEAQTTNAGTQDKRTQGERANHVVCADRAALRPPNRG